jgi:hypothetical protein
MEATASVGSTGVGEAWQDRFAPSSILKQTAQLWSCQIRSATISVSGHGTGPTLLLVRIST